MYLSYVFNIYLMIVRRVRHCFAVECKQMDEELQSNSS